MTRIRVDLPEDVSGDYAIAHYTSETTENNWRAYLDMKGESLDSYTVLTKNGCPMPIMQDSIAEYNEHQWLWDNATGDVLIGGLGIGMCHQPLIDNPNVTSVTIVEIAQDVVDLVWDSCAKDETFTLVLDDFENWNPPEGSSFDTVWADTWLIDNPLAHSEYKQRIVSNYQAYTDNIAFWSW